MIVQRAEQRTRRHREAAKLGPDLEKSLLAYACTAVAGAVSLLAMTKPAESEVVYTPAQTEIPLNGGMLPLDLNHDGIADFAFWNLGTAFSDATFLNLYVGCFPVSNKCQNPSNEIWGKGQRQHRFASALYPGVSVRPSSSYFQQNLARRGFVRSPVAVMGQFLGYGSARGKIPHSSTFGQWMYTRERYLGLQFDIGGQLHYGWARVAVTLQGNKDIRAVLTGYAYETVANQPIITGATQEADVVTSGSAGLGRLAQGASGISGWRGKK